MKVGKILIVPIELVVEDKAERYSVAFFADGLKAIKRRIVWTPSVYNGELQFYADIPRLLGQDNTFLFGQYYPHFYSKEIPRDCAYPSCHGTPRPTELSEKDIRRIMPNVDAVLVSTLAGKRGEVAIREARAHDIPVAIIDFKDHVSIFESVASEEEMCRGFKKGKDFDIFFKKALPLGRGKDYILPLAPVPVRPESYQFRALPKDTDIFYSGKMRPKGTGDRGDIVDLVKTNFPRSIICEHKDHSTFLLLPDYLDNLSRTKIALSPGGVTWDSYRHCEVGLAPKTALLAPRPYMEVVGPFLKDGVNAVLYETEFRDGKYHLTHTRELVDKIRYYLNNSRERERITDNWARDVRVGHTSLARSKYIIESIEKIL